MLPARRHRKTVFIAELTLFACIVATQAQAQTPSGTPKAPAATAPVSAPKGNANASAQAAPVPRASTLDAATDSPAKAGSATPTTPSEPGTNGAHGGVTAVVPAPNTATTGAPSTDAAVNARAVTTTKALPAVNADGNLSLASLPAKTAASTKDAADDNALMPTERVGKPPGSARWLLIGVGVGTTALWYAGAYGIRELWPSQADRSDLRIPIAGPFMDLAHTGCPASNSNCSTFQLVVRTILVSLDAIGQAGGVAMVLQGAVLGTASAAPPTPTASRLHRPISGFDVVPTPWVDGQHGAGIGLSGRF